MTLFKKVFQSQARKAEGEETPDIEALRDAMTTEADEELPLVLEPEDGLHTPFLRESNVSESDQHITQDLSEDDQVIDGDCKVAELHDDVPADDVSDETCVDQDCPGAQEPDLQSIMKQAAESLEIDASENPSLDLTEEHVASDTEAADILEMDEVSPPFEHSVIAEETDASVEQMSEEQRDSQEEDVADFARHQIQVLQGGVSSPESAEEHSGRSLKTNDIPEVIDTESSPADHKPERPTFTQVPTSATGRVARQTGRVKTRLLGFNRDTQTGNDPLDRAGGMTSPQQDKYPVGWLVVIDGPGRGHAFSIFTGASMIGRGEDQMIRLDFGDTSISRQNHAAIAYDEEVNKFYVGHGGKSNIIRRNARPVLSTEELNHADLLRIGETTLRFVALCGSDFQWNSPEDFDAAGL